jgi:hypothetical protein
MVKGKLHFEKKCEILRKERFLRGKVSKEKSREIALRLSDLV